MKLGGVFDIYEGRCLKNCKYYFCRMMSLSSPYQNRCNGQ